MLTIFVLIIITVFVAIFYTIFFNSVLSSAEDIEILEFKSNLEKIPDFHQTQAVIGYDKNSGIAIDEASKKICLITYPNAVDSWRIISFKDILSVELFEDGSSVTKTVKSSQITNTILGGLLLGGVGAIIGGLSGKTETSGNTKRIDLRLIVNDVKSPLHDIVFLNVKMKKEEKKYSQFMQLARQWHGIIEVIIKQSDDEKEIQSQINDNKTPSQITNVLVADEIKKLVDLHNSGILTLEELKQQKDKLLRFNKV